MAKEKVITIKLIKSGIGQNPNQVRTLKALGLTKINKQVTKPDNEAVRGMVATVSHLIEVIEG